MKRGIGWILLGCAAVGIYFYMKPAAGSVVNSSTPVTGAGASTNIFQSLVQGLQQGFGQIKNALTPSATTQIDPNSTWMGDDGSFTGLDQSETGDVTNSDQSDVDTSEDDNGIDDLDAEGDAAADTIADTEAADADIFV